MSYTLHNLRELDVSLVPRLAEIHMGDRGLLAKLGYSFVLRYFEIAYKDPRVIGMYAQDDESGAVVGYGVASPDPHSLTSQLTDDRAWFIKESIKVLFTHPLVFIELIISSITIRDEMKNEADAIEFVYLCVDPEFRGRHMGRSLFERVMDESRKAGYKKMRGSVAPWNKANLALSFSNGWTIRKTFREGIYRKHRMECRL